MSYRERKPVEDRLKILPHSGAPGRRGHFSLRSQSIGAEATGAKATGAKAIGALAVGAVAIGALAIGALAIGRLVIGRARIRRVEIDELVVRRLRITGEMQLPDKSEADVRDTQTSAKS